MRYIFLALILLFSSVHHAMAADYRYSQYCLIEFRKQFSLDTHYPEYSNNCSEGTEFRGNIDDPELYVLAGNHYVRGESPTAINWELQPLTKYFFGIFGNIPLLVQYLYALGIFYLLFTLSKKILLRSNVFVHLIPGLLFLTDNLTLEQLTKTYLDLGQTFFILLFIYYLWRYISSSYRVSYVSIALGLVALSKSFSIGILLGLSAFIAIYLIDKQKLGKYLRSLYISILVYLLGYTVFFVYHKPLDFLILHIDILRYYKSYVPEYPKGEIFRIIFTGQWRTWWDNHDLIRVYSWSILWPISLLSTLTLIKLKMRQNPLIFISTLWIVIYLLFVSLRLVFPRYLLPILPFAYLNLTYLLFHIVPEKFRSTKSLRLQNQ